MISLFPFCFQESIHVRIVYHVLMAIYDVAGLMAPSSDVVWYNLPVSSIVFDDGAAQTRYYSPIMGINAYSTTPSPISSSPACALIPCRSLFSKVTTYAAGWYPERQGGNG